MVEVTQEDREACTAMMRGWTEETGPQAFARHRIAAREAALDEAAGIAESGDCDSELDACCLDTAYGIAQALLAAKAKA